MRIACDDGSTYIKLAWRQDGDIKTHIAGLSFREGWKTDLFGSEKVYNFTLSGRKFTHDIGSRAALDTTHVQYQYGDANLLAVHYALLSSGLTPQPVELTVTLPVTEFFDADAQPNHANIERKRQNLLRPLVLNKGQLFEISKVEVMPESLPAVLPALCADGVTPYERSLVVDLGGTTLDCAVIVGAFESVSAIRGDAEIGTNQVTHAVMDALAAASTPVSYYVADQIVQAQDSALLQRLLNEASAFDHIQTVLHQEVANLAERVSRMIESFGGVQRLYLTGGGAALIYPAIRNRFASRHVVKLEAPQLALARAMILGE